MVRGFSASAVALLAALGAVLVFKAYRDDLARAEQHAATGSIVAQTACGPIEYAIAGDGPPLLIVHGAGGGFDQGLDFAAPLARRGHKVIAMSRFGYLRTPLPRDASAEAQADAHACLLDALGVARAAILGASAGAPSAMQFAIRHPTRVSALVLVVPAAFVPRVGTPKSMLTPAATDFLFGTALKSDFLFWAASRLARDTMVESILATPPALVAAASAAEQARVDRLLANILPVSKRREGLMNDARIVGAIGRYDLARIAAPTLAVSCEDDLYGTFDSARYTAGQIAGAKLVTWPTGGHVSVGHDGELADAVSSFLAARPDR